MHKILLLNDTIISQNYGCQLVSYSIRKALTKFFPDSTIDFYTYDKTFSNYDKDYDLVIINGEGSFGHHSQHPHGFKWVEAMTKFIKKGTPVHLVNLSIQCNLYTLKLHVPLFEKLSSISVREPISYLFLRKNTNLTNIKLFPDIGTCYFDEEVSIKKYDFAFGFGALAKEHKSLGTQISEYFGAIEKLQEEGYKIKYLGFPGNPFDDKKLAEDRLKDIDIISDGFKSYYNAVKEAKINVTGRHHGAVMSFAGKTPFVSFEANMWKTEGDQLLYGPFDYFYFRSIKKKPFIEWCKDTLVRANEQKTLLENNYDALKPLFYGHIQHIAEDLTDVIERGIIKVEDIEEQIQELDYLKLKQYELSKEVH